MKHTTVKAAALAGLMLLGSQVHAATIGIFGFNNQDNIASFLNNNGHTATALGSGPSAAELAGLDAAILIRTSGNAALDSWVRGGGTLITEWQGADWATNTVDYFGAQISGGGIIGTGTNITISAAGLNLDLGNGLSNPWSDGPRTEFARNVSDTGSATVYATRAGGNAAVFGGAIDDGYAFINTLDWADGFGSGAHNSGQFLLNMLAAQFDGGGPEPVPAPGALGLLGFGLLALRLRRRKA